MSSRARSVRIRFRSSLRFQSRSPLRTPLLNMLEGSQLSPVVRAKRSNIESGHYPPNFKLRHAAKDLRLVIEAASAVDRDLKVSAAARAWLDAAIERGAADLDYSAVVATIIGEEPKA